MSEYANAALHRGYSSGCNDLCKSADTQVGWLRHILRVRIRVGRVSERFKALSPEHFEVEMRGICQVWSWVSKGEDASSVLLLAGNVENFLRVRPLVEPAKNQPRKGANHFF